MPNTLHRLEVDGEEWEHAIRFPSDIFGTAYNYRRENKTADQGALIARKIKKFNQVNMFLAASRSRLYNANGNRTEYTYLYSDAAGKISALVFFPASIAEWFSQDFNIPAMIETSHLKGDAQYTAKYNKEYLTPTVGSSGYSSIRLISKDGYSEATRVFAARTPTKIIPSDNRGTI